MVLTTPNRPSPPKPRRLVMRSGTEWMCALQRYVWTPNHSDDFIRFLFWNPCAYTTRACICHVPIRIFILYFIIFYKLVIVYVLGYRAVGKTINGASVSNTMSSLSASAADERREKATGVKTTGGWREYERVFHRRVGT